MYYVYEWFVKETGEIFYVGKGCDKRYLCKSQRNKYFKDYIKNNYCQSRIIKTFETEQEALNYEHERICELKKQGLCKCNLDNGGTGGTSFIWTKEMKEYKSKYNPMKSQKQRERMSTNNPMKNKDVAKEVGNKHKKKVIINGILYESLVDAGNKLGKHPNEIGKWCKRGYDINRKPCRYFGEKQKEIPDLKVTCSKKVIIDEKLFNSVKEGASYLGVCSESLIRAIKNNRKCKGHVCEYGNQQPSHENTDKSIVEGSTTR